MTDDRLKAWNGDLLLQFSDGDWKEACDRIPALIPNY